MPNKQKQALVINALEKHQTFTEIKKLCETLTVEEIRAENENNENPIDFLANMFVRDILEDLNEGEELYPPKDIAKFIEIFMGYGVEVKAHTFFDIAWHSKDAEAIIKMVQSPNFDVNMQDAHDRNVLNMVIFNYECGAEIANVLLNNGADPNKYSALGETSLHSLMSEIVNNRENKNEKTNLELVEIFIKHGSNPHITNGFGENCYDILNQKHNPNRRMTSRMTELNYIGKIEKKLDVGAKKIIKLKKTLIDHIMSKTPVEGIKQALEKGDISINETKHGLSALWFINGFRFNEINEEEPTEHWERTTQLITLLLESGIDVQLPNKKNEQFLDYYIGRRTELEVVEELIKYGAISTKNSLDVLTKNNKLPEKTKNSIKKILENAILEKNIITTSSDYQFSI